MPRTFAQKAARKAARIAGIAQRASRSIGPPRDPVAREAWFAARRAQIFSEGAEAMMALTPAILRMRESSVRNERDRCPTCSRPGLLPEACDARDCPRRTEP